VPIEAIGPQFGHTDYRHSVRSAFGDTAFVELHVSDEAAEEASGALAVVGQAIGDADRWSFDDDSIDQAVLGALAQLVTQRSAGDADEQVPQFIEAPISRDVERGENLDGPSAGEDVERFDRGFDLPSDVVCATLLLGENLADSRTHPLGGDDAGFEFFQALRGQGHGGFGHVKSPRCSKSYKVWKLHLDITFTTPRSKYGGPCTLY
jgi:hypothetical protein